MGEGKFVVSWGIHLSKLSQNKTKGVTKMDVKFTDLTAEQVEQLRHLEQEWGCNLLAVEPHQNDEH